MLSLQYPWLLLLAAIPLVLQWRRPTSTSVDAPVIPIGHWLSDLPGVSHRGNALPRWQALLLMLVWILLTVALARPQYVGEQIQLPITGRDLMLVVDISPSMDEQDMVLGGRSINRLQAVKRPAGADPVRYPSLHTSTVNLRPGNRQNPAAGIRAGHGGACHGHR